MGSCSKTLLFPKKNFLSVNKSRETHIQEWSIRTLNIVQVVLRNFFGGYKDTHLKTITTAWNHYQSTHGNVCPSLSKKIDELWAKKHKTSLLEESSQVFMFGNSLPIDAAIIGICQLHSDPDEAKFTSKIIQENYREGDIVLVEGIDADRSVCPNEVPQTWNFPKNAEIHGWEPVGFQALSDFVFEPVISVLKEFESQAAIFTKLFGNINFEKVQPKFSFNQYSAKQKASRWNDCFKSAAEGFVKAVEKIEARFSGTPDAIHKLNQSIAKLLQMFLDEYKVFMLSSKNTDEAKKMFSVFSELYEQCSRHITQNKYKTGWTQAQNNFFINTWNTRQTSLANEVNRNIELKKRIFVCAGAALFFPKRGSETSASLSAIQKHKYCLVIQNNESNATYYSFADLAKRYGRLF
jgi:hypothetical protein